MSQIESRSATSTYRGQSQQVVNERTTNTSDRILNLRRLMSLQFREEHWAHLGRMTDCVDLISSHDRLGELHWGDNGYDACVLHALTAIVDRCPEALILIEAYVERVCEATKDSELSNATLVRL